MATDTSNRFIKVDGSFERFAGDPITGTPTVPFVTVGGQNYAYNAAGSSPAPASRSLDLGNSAPGGTPPPALPSSSPVQPGGGNDPMANFGLLMTGMLKQAQGVNTADFLARKRALDRAVVNKTSAITPEDMRTLSPSQQDAIRSGNVQALKPDIDQNSYELEKAQKSIDSFFKVYGEAQKLSQDFADKMVAPASVIANAAKVIEGDPARMSSVLSGFNDKSKQKIIEGLDYNKIKDASDKASAGLTVNQLQNSLDKVADDFRMDPAVQQYTQAGAGWSSLSSIKPDTANPADDIAAIYAFAKIMDPNSVVREGEYATVQKYAQSWAQAFGFKAERIFSNTKFLSSAALAALKSAAQTKFAQSESAYQSARKTYEQRQADLKAGKTGVGSLPDYGYSPARTAVVTDPKTGQVKEGILSADEVKDAQAQGYTVTFK